MLLCIVQWVCVTLTEIGRFSDLGEDAAAKKKNELRFSGVSLTALARGKCYAGFGPVGLPMIYHNILGERVVCVIDLEEAIQWYCYQKNVDIHAEGYVPPPIKDCGVM